MRAPAPAVLPTTSPQVQRRKLGPALQLPEARVETGAHTFGERLSPCPGVPRLKAPGPQMPRLLWVPRGGPARGKGHARVPGQRRRSPGQPQLQRLPGEQTGRRMAPRPRRQALPDILRVWEGAARVQTSRRRSEAGGQAARPPTTAASLKSEPLLGKLKDARILLRGQKHSRTTGFQPNSPTLSRFSKARISPALRKIPPPTPNLMREQALAMDPPSPTTLSLFKSIRTF